VDGKYPELPQLFASNLAKLACKISEVIAGETVPVGLISVALVLLDALEKSKYPDQQLITDLERFVQGGLIFESQIETTRAN
jgi:hypothetical protein